MPLGTISMTSSKRTQIGCNLHHSELLFWPLKYLDETSVASLPKVDIMIHVSRRSNIFSRCTESYMIPTQPVDNVLELVLDLKLDIVMVDTRLQQIGNVNCSNDAITAISNHISSWVGKSKKYDEAITAYSCWIYDLTWPRFYNIQPAFACAGNDMISQRGENSNTGSLLCILSRLFFTDVFTIKSWAFWCWW